MASPSTHPNPSPTAPLIGSCLCGGVRYEITGRIGPIGFCHCAMCRKAQGGPFSTNAPVRRRYLRLVAGAELITEYESSPEKWRCFCRKCGSPVYSRRASDPDTVRIRIGLLDGPPGREPTFHVLVEDKASWYRITDDLPFIDARTGETLPQAKRKRLME